MIGGRRFAWARARAALPALATLCAVAAVSSLLIVAGAIALRAVEAHDVRASLDAASGDGATAIVAVGDGDPAAVETAARQALAARHATALSVTRTDAGIEIAPDTSRFTGDDVTASIAALRALSADLRESVDARLQIIGGLESTLGRISEGMQNRRGPTAVAVAFLGLLTIVVMGAVALEPVRARAGESLLLRARGARRRSLGALAGVEAAVISLVGALAGGGLALLLGAALGLPSPGLGLAAAAVVAVVVAAAATATVVAVRTADTRSTRAQVAAFAGAAVVLAVITGLAAWQFAQSGTPVVTRGDGSSTLDPLVAVAPALLLALAALIAVLVATPVARAVARALSVQRGVSPVTALRLASRRPGRHALPIAVVAFAVGASSIAGAYTGTVDALGDAPEALRVGADLRVTTIPDTTDAGEVIAAAGDDAQAAMPVRAFSAKGSDGRIAVIAAEAERVGEVMLDAGGTIDPASVGSSIATSGSGIPLSGDIRFTLSTPLPPEQEDPAGGTWQPGATTAFISFTLVSDTGERRVEWRPNGPVDPEELDGRFSPWDADPDYRGTIELPGSGDAQWSLLAVDVSIAVGSYQGDLTLRDVTSGGETLDLTAFTPAPGTPGRVTVSGDGLVFQPHISPSGDMPATRVLAPGLETTVPVVMTEALAASLSLSRGETIALEFDGPDFEADVVLADVIPVLPGSVTGEGMLADAGALALLSPQPIVPNQAWFATTDADAVAAAVRAAFPGPTVLVADPRAGAAAAGTAWGFVLAAVGAVVLALIVLVLRRTRSRPDSRELALFAVFGLGRLRAARLRAGEDLFALSMGVVGGLAAGAVTAWLVVPPLVRAAYGTVPDAYPVPLSWPWLPLSAALAAVVVAFAAVIVSVRAPRRLASLLREDE